MKVKEKIKVGGLYTVNGREVTVTKVTATKVLYKVGFDTRYFSRKEFEFGARFVR